MQLMPTVALPVYGPEKSLEFVVGLVAKCGYQLIMNEKSSPAHLIILAFVCAQVEIEPSAEAVNDLMNSVYDGKGKSSRVHWASCSSAVLPRCGHKTENCDHISRQ